MLWRDSVIPIRRYLKRLKGQKKGLKRGLSLRQVVREPVVITIDGSHGTGKTAFGDTLRETLGELMGEENVVMTSRGDYTDMAFESFKKELAERYGIDTSSPDYGRELLRKLGKEGEDINKVVGESITEEDSARIDKDVL